MSLLANSNAIESGGYNIDRSLRFRSSASAYLNRTPTSSGSGSIWTYSAWIKRGQLGSQQYLMTAIYDGALTTGILFNANDQLRVTHYDGYTVGTVYDFVTTQVFRDPSAWYHIVVSSNSSTWMRIYVNGVLVTSFATNTGASATASLFNQATYIHKIGVWGYAGNNYYYDGLIAEHNWIDGQALAATDFGQTDPVTGVWQPKKYTGTYGTNGFYLPFTDNTSATTLAYDKSGNGNNWTPNNISTTAGATYDSMTDVPTLTSATAANYCVLNPLQSASGVLSNANLTGALTANTDSTATFGLSSGKWYWEETLSAYNSGGNLYCGVVDTTYFGTNAGWSYSQAFVYLSTGQKGGNGSASSYGATYTTNDVIGIALDMDTGTIEFYKNGTSQGQAFNTNIAGKTLRPLISCGSGGTCTWQANFGQRPFSYTPPTGFKALNTFNLPDPTIKKPNQYMDATTYTGTGNALPITNGGFQPSLVWLKSRSNATFNALIDSTRGVDKVIYSNDTRAEETVTDALTSFDANGFTIAANSTFNTINVSPRTYVGWQWKESATAGFDIVTYTGNGGTQNISHSLGVAPKMIIVKSRSRSDVGWPVYHINDSATPNNGYMLLNGTGAFEADSAVWNNTAPTSSVFTVGNLAASNASGATYVAYLFAEIAGFSKFGSFSGNASTDGPFVFCGFRPKYILLKSSSVSGYNWIVLDSARGTYNINNTLLYPNLSAADDSFSSGGIDFLSNGFKIRTSSAAIQQSGSTTIFAAFADNPFKYALGV